MSVPGFATIRAELEEALRPLLPAKPTRWTIIRNQRDQATLDRPTVVFKSSGLESHPTAPSALYLARLVVTVASHHTDLEKGEDAADQLVLQTLDALGRLPWSVDFQGAQKVVYASKYAAYDITITIDTTP